MKPTIVFVDDDPNMRESIKRVLRNEAYRLVILESAQQCVEILAFTSIQVLITDLSMPGFNGKTLIKYFRDNKPEVIRVVLSGNLNLQTMFELVNSGEVFRCHEKPCDAPVLLSTIKEALHLVQIRTADTDPSEQARVDCPNDSNQHNLTSLVHEAVEDVERLNKALTQYCEQESPISKKAAYVKQ